VLKRDQQIWRNNRFLAWRPNGWDFIALVLIFVIFIILAWQARQMSAPYHIGQAIKIHLAPRYLPGYCLRTVVRMFIAMGVSLLVTFVVGALAAKNKHAERVIIPLIDILQSVPVIGYLSITVTGFIALFPGSLLGPQCAVVFAIFTAQAWNMILGFYQSLRTLPPELNEAASILHLSAWQRFWRVEVPFAMPSLLWNVMLSMSASWFFVVAAEAITVNNQSIMLPGVGSYIAEAIAQANTKAIFLVIVAMLVVIVLYDQLIFRPIVCWGDKFKTDLTGSDQKPNTSWVISLLQRTRLLHYLGRSFALLLDAFVNIRPSKKIKALPEMTLMRRRRQRTLVSLWYLVVLGLCALGGFILLHYIFHQLTLPEAGHVVVLGFYTALRVIVLIIISSLIWVPIGVWIGLRPNVIKYAQPIVQILAAFPANLLFPIIVMGIIMFHLNVNIWTTPLMMLGAQWYILFNVIAGASAIPKDLHYVTSNFGVNRWLWWKRLILPGLFPYYVTGAITAAGGAWNASIVAEIASWGKHTIVAKGLGAYITQFTNSGDFPKVALGIAVMCIYVLLFNRVIWQPLYNLAQKRFSLD
jgi:NitT/TauT family transport system permease protein